VKIKFFFLILFCFIFAVSALAQNTEQERRVEEEKRVSLDQAKEQ
jgi:hypothetical protein